MKIQQDEWPGLTASFLCTASSKASTPYIRKHCRSPPLSSITQRISLVVTPLQVATACYIVLCRRLQSHPVEAPTRPLCPLQARRRRLLLCACYPELPRITLPRTSVNRASE